MNAIVYLIEITRGNRYVGRFCKKRSNDHFELTRYFAFHRSKKQHSHDIAFNIPSRNKARDLNFYDIHRYADI